jgi:hypothetical protein
MGHHSATTLIGMPREPGTCPGCGANWRIGPASRILVGTQHCRCSTTIGGCHREYRCQDCDAVLVPDCVDPARQTDGYGYRQDLEP